MARLNVNPTRMQLKLLKKRVAVAKRGHKMLKEKLEEMVRNFTTLAYKNYEKRKALEEKFRKIIGDFSFAKGYMSNNEVLATFMLQKQSFSLKCNEKSFMNILVPQLELENVNNEYKLPYSFVETNSLFDGISNNIYNILPDILDLCEIEKTLQILANEIEKNKRRVNALEFVMIPNLTETIKYIDMKIAENERAGQIRIMKVKSMLEKEE